MNFLQSCPSYTTLQDARVLFCVDVQRLLVDLCFCIDVIGRGCAFGSVAVVIELLRSVKVVYMMAGALSKRVIGEIVGECVVGLRVG